MSAVIRQRVQERGLPASRPIKTTALKWIKSGAQEPLVQFLILGLLLWAGEQYWRAHHDRYTIDIGPVDQQRIALAYLQQFGQEPTSKQLQVLLDSYVREEIFVREGLALDLDKNDEIVRRRVVQKYEFLQTNLAVPDAPTSDVLEQWFNDHRARYMTPQHVAFSHVYFSVDLDGEKAAKARAFESLKMLRGKRISRAQGLGDPFPGPSGPEVLTPDEAVKLFGQSEFSAQLFNLPVGQWAGPYRSGYGWHLVFVSANSPPALPPVAQVQKQLLTDYVDEQRRILNARAFDELKARYAVRYVGAQP